jgi:hypothetical protein
VAVIALALLHISSSQLEGGWPRSKARPTDPLYASLQHCLTCGTHEHVRPLRLPYVFRYLINELAGMGVAFECDFDGLIKGGLAERGEDQKAQLSETTTKARQMTRIDQIRPDKSVSRRRSRESGPGET